MTRRAIERKAIDVARRAGQIGVLPVDLERVAESLGVIVKEFDLGKEVSGVLTQKGDRFIIGVNSTHSSQRKRFTIAHEIGHYVLHSAHEAVFVDRSFSVKYRDARSSTGEIRLEREANAFAASLLMPARLVKLRVKDQSFDIGDDSSLNQLASDFGVSSQAMMFRLINLDLLPPSDIE